MLCLVTCIAHQLVIVLILGGGDHYAKRTKAFNLDDVCFRYRRHLRYLVLKDQTINRPKKRMSIHVYWSGYIFKTEKYVIWYELHVYNKSILISQTRRLLLIYIFFYFCEIAIYGITICNWKWTRKGTPLGLCIILRSYCWKCIACISTM